MLKEKNILLGVCGSIAAYKGVELASKLRQAHAVVNVLMTRAATEFIKPLSFNAVTGNETIINLFQDGAMSHIQLTEGAGCLLIAPATANTIGKIAGGIGDNALTSTVLAAKCPVFIAPAMNERMWINKAVQKNVALLKARGMFIIGPDIGHLACDTVGLGRMSQPDDIVSTLRKYFTGEERLRNKKIIITAGGTREPIDSIRFITNRSSGKMGYALASEARLRGADVTLISAPTLLAPPDADLINVNTAMEMRDAVLKKFPESDAVIMSAAVSDYQVANKIKGKIKKSDKPVTLTLEPNDDILLELGNLKRKQVLIGFAAEARDLIKNAKNKLLDKNLDLIIANDITQKNGGFASENNQVSIISKNNVEELPLMSKRELAGLIIERLSDILN